MRRTTCRESRVGGRADAGDGGQSLGGRPGPSGRMPRPRTATGGGLRAGAAVPGARGARPAPTLAGSAWRRGRLPSHRLLDERVSASPVLAALFRERCQCPACLDRLGGQAFCRAGERASQFFRTLGEGGAGEKRADEVVCDTRWERGHVAYGMCRRLTYCGGVVVEHLP